MKNYYQILGIENSANIDEINTAYQRMLLAVDTEAERSELERIYTILCDHALRDQYDRSLDEENSPAFPLVASKAPLPQKFDVTTIIMCPQCNTQNPRQASACQNCGSQLSVACPNCGYKIALAQTICPRCETFIPEYRELKYAQAKFVEDRVKSERKISQMRLESLEQGHTARRILGFIFWMVVIAIVIGMCFGMGSLFDSLT